MRASSGLRRCAVLATLLLLAGCRTMPPVHQSRHRLERTCAGSTATRSYEYLVYLPDGYDAEGAEHRRWPLILSLPGMLSSGRGKPKPIRGGPAMEVEKGRRIPAVLITLFTPRITEPYSPALVGAILDQAEARYRIDPDRVTVTGVSLGGCGAWDAAQALPDRIAAIAPVAAWGRPWAMRGMRDVSVWAFHGGLDFAIPSPFHARMVRAHRCAGGDARWTLHRGGFHWIWDDVYARDDLYDWLLEQRRPQAHPPGTPGSGVGAGGCAPAPSRDDVRR